MRFRVGWATSARNDAKAAPKPVFAHDACERLPIDRKSHRLAAGE